MAGGATPGGAFSGNDDDTRMITDINVTPLVDITLVLLIIFMVTTSYIVNPSIKVDLPKAATADAQVKTSLTLTLRAEGTIYLNGEQANEQVIERFITEALPHNADLQAVIAADKVVPHGRVVDVIDLIRRAGVRRFAINVEKP